MFFSTFQPYYYTNIVQKMFSPVEFYKYNTKVVQKGPKSQFTEEGRLDEVHLVTVQEFDEILNPDQMHAMTKIFN